jgi:serine/threonine protein kinase
MVGTYRILKRLGTGGMGEVYLAMDTRLGRHVAIKFLPPRFTTDETVLRRFQQEARTASGLNHPNILTIFEVGEQKGEHFIVSEFIEGITLRTALKRDQIDLAAALDIGTQIASALMAAHSAGVVHRDLKPTNIMIRTDGYVKIIDFGLAKLSTREPRHPTSRDETLTKPGSLIGTVDYMSPEQARGEEVDYRTDLWSFGVVFYEMVTKKRPFDGATDSHVVVGILENAVPALDEAAGVPPVVAAVIQRALAKDRSKRYQTAGQLASDLKEARRSLGFSAHSVSSLHLARPRRWTLQWLIVPALLLLLWAGIIWWSRFGVEEHVLGPDWFVANTPRQMTFDGKVKLATISPDGSRLAYATGDPGQETLHVRDLKSGKDLETVGPIQDNFRSATFGPDSKSVFYVVRNNQLVGTLYSISGSDHRPHQLKTNVAEKITFSPDGKRFAYMPSTQIGSGSYTILISNSNDFSDNRVLLTKTDAQLIRSGLAWSPKGDVIADIVYGRRMSGSTRPSVNLFDTTKDLPGIKTLEFDNWRAAQYCAWIDDGRILLASVLTQHDDDDQWHLKQISIRTGRTQDLNHDTNGYESISATSDSKSIAAVRSNKRASIWLSESSDPTNAHRITPETERYQSVAWSSSDRIIAPSPQGKGLNLWSIAIDGSSTFNIKSEPFVDREPAVIPSAHSLIFSSNRAAGGQDFNLWHLNLDSSEPPAQLTYGASFDRDPTVSPDGKWIVYTSWPSITSESLWKLQIAGNSPPIQVTPYRARTAAISPDGKKIVCEIMANATAPWRVVILSLENGQVEEVFPDIPIGSPTRWTPDGKSLTFIRTENGISNIWKQPVKGGSPQSITKFKDGLIFSFAWSPDGTKLAILRGSYGRDVVLFSRK